MSTTAKKAHKIFEQENFASVVEKLHPRRFPNMSPKMSAIVGFLVGAKYASPQIAEITSLSDGGVLTRHEGDMGFNDFMGAYSDLLNNWTTLLDAAGLSPAERKIAENLFTTKVRRF